MSADGAAGRREVAIRVFAAEYDDADLEYSESDEERAPNYVLTPTGARINRLFAVGVLTEVEPVSDDVLRGRVVDPTGAFVVYAGQYQPDAKTALERTEPPAFVAVTGKARTFTPDDADRVYTSIRPESINTVDDETRDRWTVQAAEHTIERVRTFAAAMAREERGDALRAVLLDAGVEPALAAGIPRAIDHYGTTEAYLTAVRELAVAAAEVVAGEREEVEPLTAAPDEGGAVEGDLTDGVTLEAGATGGAGEEWAGTATPQRGEEPGEAAEPSAGGDIPSTDEPATAGEPAAGATEPSTTTGAAVSEAGADDDERDAAGADEEALGDFDDFGSADADASTVPDDDGTPAGGTDELYELDEEERAAVEEEYGTEFSTGSEVDGPGETDIEPPEPEAGAADEDDVAAEEATEPADAEDEEPAEPGEPGGPAEDVDLVDAVVAAMDELDEGDGADRDAVVDAVAGDHDVEEAAVEEAVQDALMAGRCYEPADGRVKAI